DHGPRAPCVADRQETNIMGLFDFVKSAWEKLLDLDPTRKAAEVLADHVRKFKLGGDYLKVEREGTKVTVSGQARSQEEKEKIILALGNVSGVEQVQDVLFIDPSQDGPVAQPPSALDAAPSAPAPVAEVAASEFHTVKKG